VNGVSNLSLKAVSSVGKIAFIDLEAQQRRIRERIEKRLSAVLDHGRYIGGPEIIELEELLVEKTGAKKAVACGSGTAALIIPLLAKGIKSTDAVFVPSFTYNATANAVILAGGTPVFVDIDERTFNIDPISLEAQIERIKAEGKLTPAAVIPVDLFGSPAAYDAIHVIAERENIFVLSDGAQSFGGRQNGKWVGALTEETATSFFPGKALGAYGDAGAVLSTSDEMGLAWESIRWHGTDVARKNSVCVGFNGRMDSFQAAILLEKLDIFYEELEARHRIAEIYNLRLSKTGIPQNHLEGSSSGYGYYALRLKGRDHVAVKLKEFGVPTAIYYTTPLHKMEAFSAYSVGSDLTKTELVSREILSLPMHPYLTPEQANFICDCIESACISD